MKNTVSGKLPPSSGTEGEREIQIVSQSTREGDWGTGREKVEGRSGGGERGERTKREIGRETGKKRDRHGEEEGREREREQKK